MSTTAVSTPAATAATRPSTPAGSAATTISRSRDDFAMLPPVDVVEDAQGITLYADLPGVAREQLQLRVDGDQLIVEAEMRLDMPEGLTTSHAEVTSQHYRRSFHLSKELDADRISAELTQGVLRVRLPKAAHAQPRKIDVRLS